MFKMLLKLCICAWGYMHVSAVPPEARGKRCPWSQSSRWLWSRCGCRVPDSCPLQKPVFGLNCEPSFHPPGCLFKVNLFNVGHQLDWRVEEMMFVSVSCWGGDWTSFPQGASLARPQASKSSSSRLLLVCALTDTGQGLGKLCHHQAPLPSVLCDVYTRHPCFLSLREQMAVAPCLCSVLVVVMDSLLTLSQAGIWLWRDLPQLRYFCFSCHSSQSLLHMCDWPWTGLLPVVFPMVAHLSLV